MQGNTLNPCRFLAENLQSQLQYLHQALLIHPWHHIKTLSPSSLSWPRKDAIEFFQSHILCALVSAGMNSSDLFVADVLI